MFSYLEQQKNQEHLVDDTQRQDHTPECWMGSQQETVPELQHAKHTERSDRSEYTTKRRKREETQGVSKDLIKREWHHTKKKNSVKP